MILENVPRKYALKSKIDVAVFVWSSGPAQQNLAVLHYDDDETIA